MEKEIFRQYTPDYQKIFDYGFKKVKEGCLYEISFFNGEFIARIILCDDGTIFGKIYETETKSEYLPLRNYAQQGEFVNKIRQEYENILKEIRENCFRKNLFVTPQANRIADFVVKKYGESPVFMWKNFRPTVFLKM